MSDARSELPEWSAAAVCLLRGSVDVDDGRTWDLLLSNVTSLEDNFVRLGLRLVVDEDEGIAYLRQFEEDEAPSGYESLPKLFRTTRMSYGQTLLCVLLRERYAVYEEENVHDDRCVVDGDVLFDQWRSLLPEQDEIKQKREMERALNRLADLGLVRRLDGETPGWEVRRILKARLPARTLGELRDRLATARRAEGVATAVPEVDS